MRGLVLLLSCTLLGCAFDTTAIDNPDAPSDTSDAAVDLSMPEAVDEWVDTGDDADDVVSDTAIAETCATMVCGSSCVDTSSDPRFCGSCTNDCTQLPHVDGNLVTCTAGQCSIPSNACVSGFGDCDHDAGNGCEAPLDTTSNCGSCATHCAVACMQNSSGGFTCL